MNLNFLCKRHLAKSKIKSDKKNSKKDFQILYFADGDDKFDHKRLQKTINFLTTMICCKRINYFWKKIKKNFKLLRSLKNKKKIRLKDIKDKNFVGCSNTAVKTTSLKKIIRKINPKLIAFDWCTATLLLMNRNRGIFTNETFTYYRQYNNNTSGVSDFSKKSIINDFNTKINHYKYFNF